jgi:hypothetical protein
MRLIRSKVAPTGPLFQLWFETLRIVRLRMPVARGDVGGREMALVGNEQRRRVG